MKLAEYQQIAEPLKQKRDDARLMYDRAKHANNHITAFEQIARATAFQEALEIVLSVSEANP